MDATQATQDVLETPEIVPVLDIAGAKGHVMNLLLEGLVSSIAEVLER